MFPEDVPIILAYTVSGFAASYGSKFEGTVNEGVELRDIKPFFGKVEDYGVLHNRPMCQMDGLGVFQWLVTDE